MLDQFDLYDCENVKNEFEAMGYDLMIEKCLGNKELRQFVSLKNDY